MFTHAIIDERNDWYDVTNDPSQEIPKGHRIVHWHEAQHLSRSWEPWKSDPDALKARIAELRWQKESQGIYIGEQFVSTLREEMPVWQGMLLDIALRPGATTEFEYKPRGGANVVLSPQQVQRIYECFAWYVAACFATERTLVGAIDAGTPLPQVIAMLDTVWPQTQFDWTPPNA